MTVDLASLIDPDAPLTRIGSGYQFTEGPVWVPAESCLLFSDIPGDARWRWTRADGMELDLFPTFKGNGMALDNDGHLLVCEQVSSCLVRFRDGTRELVAYHYGGTYLNSPNDVVARGSDGSIYFTDPDYGRWNDWIGQERSRDGVGYNAVFRVPPGGGELELVVAEDEFDQPNGLCFSPDEKLLYVNDSGNLTVKVFEVAADGSLGPARVIAEGVGIGGAGRQLRRHGVRRARQRLGHGPRRRLGADARGRAHRHRRDARGLRQPLLGRWRGAAHALPDDLDDRAHDRDDRRAGAAAARSAAVQGLTPTVVLGLVRVVRARASSGTPRYSDCLSVSSVRRTLRWSRCRRATSSSSSLGSM